MMLLQRHGADAGIQAALQIDQLASNGDDAGARAWRLVLAAIDELQRKTRQPTETVH